MAPVARRRRVAGVLCCAIVSGLVLSSCATDSSKRVASAPASPPPTPVSTPITVVEPPEAPADEVVTADVPASPPQPTHRNREAARGNDPMSATGALMGDQVRSNFGVGGLGLSGTGRGGGAVGQGYGVAERKSHRRALSLSPGAFHSNGDFNTEGYARVDESHFVSALDQPLSTFSIDVDTASYANVRRFLREGSLPPPDAVRVEEMLNYFRYRYTAPADDKPFAVTTEVASAPWAPQHRLLLVGLQARTITQEQTPPRNLVFLIDVSGSMASTDRLPLIKSGLSLLARQLREQDRIAIVVYAGNSGVVLPTTHGSDQARVLAALDRLEAGGSTNGGEGIELAYRLATRSFIRGGVNRVVLATDGDFNVGVTSHGDLTRLIEAKRKSGVFLSVLGVGRGNLQDATMEALADRGNGNYAYIDSMREAQRALVREAGGTLVTLAKDVKLQVEFNPTQVASYRLIGYDNRRLANQDFNNDAKDAGELGAGHSVTALYEIIPHGIDTPSTDAANTGAPVVDALRYQRDTQPTGEHSDELATIKLRHKAPDADHSTASAFIVRDSGHTIDSASNNLRWAAAVSSFGMVLGQSTQRGEATLALARQLARGAVGNDTTGDRAELIELITLAERLSPGRPLHVAR